MSLYRTSEVDRIARELVTEAMIDYALTVNYVNSKRSRKDRTRPDTEWLANPVHRQTARRNIAIGIQAGSYSIAQFEAEQAVRKLMTAVKA